MAKKVVSEDMRKKALEYRALTLEKFKATIQELETRKEALLDGVSSKAQQKEIRDCYELISQIKEEVKNVSAIPDDMFVNVVSDRDLLLNVLFAFDQSKIEQRESHLISQERAAEIAAKRQERKKTCRKMSVEELLDLVMDNERLETEILRIKIAHNQKSLQETFGAVPSSR